MSYDEQRRAACGNRERSVTLTDRIKSAVSAELERRRVTTDGEPGLVSVSLIVKMDEKSNRPRQTFYRIETRSDHKSDTGAM